MTLASLGRAMGFLDENLAGFRRRGEICLYAPDHAAVYRPPVASSSSTPSVPAAAAAAEADGPTSASEASASASTGLALEADPAAGATTPTTSSTPHRWRPQRFPRGMELPSLVATVVGDSGTWTRVQGPGMAMR